MKIMFTSVGRRVELLEAFRLAAVKLNIKLEIYGADIVDNAPALYFCDHIVMLPPIKAKNYISELQRICVEEEIDILIPTIDTDLIQLAQERNRFEKTMVMISTPDKVALCRDKQRTVKYFNSVGLKSPFCVDSWKEYSAGYPAFIKSKKGSSSIFAYKVENEKQLEFFAEQLLDYVVQPFIEGTEYTVDIFCDFKGNPIFITPRIRLAVRAGEVLKAEISQDKKIIEEIKILLADYKPCGQITVQLIREKNTGEDWYIEINPRFGGGAPLTMMAGADSAEALIRLFHGEQIEYMECAAEDGAVYSRFDKSVRIK